MGKYVNYYNDENTNLTFEFNNMTKEEAKRLQAYMLQDNHLIIYDENILDKISEKKEEIDETKPYMTGVITLEKSKSDKGHTTISGTSKSVDFSGEETITRYCANIFEGLNFVSISGFREDEKTHHCMFSSVNWFHDKIYNPERVVRFNTKQMTIGAIEQDKFDLEGEDLEYTVSEGFDISHNPTEEFKKGMKSVKVKKK